MSRIATEEHDGIWQAWLRGSLTEQAYQGKTEKEAVQRLSFASAEASILLSQDRDYWIERWKPKTDEEALALFRELFG